jgi:hypothetical protein
MIIGQIHKRTQPAKPSATRGFCLFGILDLTLSSGTPRTFWLIATVLFR